jgi:phage terminase large subunit-like protein
MGMPAVASGDLILWLGDPAAKGLNPTTGYTYIVGSGTLTDGNAVQVYRKVSVGADAGTLSMTSAPFLGTKDLDALVLTFSGVDNTTPIDVHSNGSGTTNTSLTATSITTTRANELIVAAFLYQNSSAFTPPAGMITKATVSLPNSTFDTLAVCTVLQAAAGASGNKVATIGTTATWGFVMLALNPVITGTAFWNNFVLSSEVDS